jgi:hypothetical protein
MLEVPAAAGIELTLLSKLLDDPDKTRTTSQPEAHRIAMHWVTSATARSFNHPRQLPTFHIAQITAVRAAISEETVCKVCMKFRTPFGIGILAFVRLSVAGMRWKRIDEFSC